MANNPKMWKYTVEGMLTFPFDMLRYDRAWPADEEQSAVMDKMTRRGDGPGPFQVTLKGLSGPTSGRWESFGWKVLRSERVSY